MAENKNLASVIGKYNCNLLSLDSRFVVAGIQTEAADTHQNGPSDIHMIHYMPADALAAFALVIHRLRISAYLANTLQ